MMVTINNVDRVNHDNGYGDDDDDDDDEEEICTHMY